MNKSRPVSVCRAGCLAAVGLLATVPAQNRLYTFNGDAANDRLGVFVSGAGDVNKDGYPDLIAGALYDDNNGSSSGMVRVYSGKDGRILGDVNNDGYADVIAGAWHDDNNGTYSGSARVFSGKDGKILHTFNGDSAGDEFGTSVSEAGDVNKDGYGDVIVGAWHDDNNGSDSGMARVFSGKDGKVLHTFNGDSAGDRFGTSVSSAADVNKDGFPDLVVGATFDDNNGADSGMVRIFSGKNSAILHSFNGDAVNDQLGKSVCGAGDVNKDGWPDVIAGAIVADTKNGTDSGMVRVYSGVYIAVKAGPPVLYTFNGDSAGDHFGTAVSDAGDVNKDSYPDLFAGALLDDNKGLSSGMVRVFSGKDGKILYTFDGDSAGDWLGAAVGNAGDVNKDGYPDLIAGAFLDDNNGGASGSAYVFSGKALALSTDTHAFSLAKANTQTLSIDAGTANKGRRYWVFGSVTGTSPGITLGSAIGAVTIPLNPDPWTDITIGLANSPVLVNTKGTLDNNGQAKAQIKGGPVNAPSAIGLVLHHAYLVYAGNNFYMASNPATLLLEK
jgi:hypothetical protein